KENELLRIIEDPTRFAEVMLGHDLWPKQAQILQSVASHSWTEVKACHASGKTFTAAEAVLWWITRHQQAIAVTTAPTWTQVERLLWSEIRNADRAGAHGGGIYGLLSYAVARRRLSSAGGTATTTPGRSRNFRPREPAMGAVHDCGDHLQIAD